MSVSRAKGLLNSAAKEPQRLRRHLLVAAALREALPREPVVVGGTAEEFWTADEYHETDLDLCVPIDRKSEQLLKTLGFGRTGRHWFHEASKVAVEFPDTTIDGDAQRVHRENIHTAQAAIIGLDDLYLDRLRQATVSEATTGIEFHSALAVAAARYEDIDWDYVHRRIDNIAEEEPSIASLMKAHDSRIRRRVRQALSES